MMDARAPNNVITFSVPVWITKSDPDGDYMDWLHGKLTGVGWDEHKAREVKGSIAVSMRIASPVPPAGLSKRKQAVLEAGGVVWRDTGLPATEIAAILIRAMGLRRGQVTRLNIERVYTLGPAGRVDIEIESL